MLIEGFLLQFFGLLETILGVLPDATDLALDGSLGTFIGYAKGFDAAFPVTEALVLVSAWLTVQVAILAFGLIRTIYKLIPFI